MSWTSSAVVQGRGFFLWYSVALTYRGAAEASEGDAGQAGPRDDGLAASSRRARGSRSCRCMSCARARIRLGEDEEALLLLAAGQVESRRTSRADVGARDRSSARRHPWPPRRPRGGRGVPSASAGEAMCAEGQLPRVSCGARSARAPLRRRPQRRGSGARGRRDRRSRANSSTRRLCRPAHPSRPDCGRSPRKGGRMSSFDSQLPWTDDQWNVVQAPSRMPPGTLGRNSFLPLVAPLSPSTTTVLRWAWKSIRSGQAGARDCSAWR